MGDIGLVQAVALVFFGLSGFFIHYQTFQISLRNGDNPIRITGLQLALYMTIAVNGFAALLHIVIG